MPFVTNELAPKRAQFYQSSKTAFSSDLDHSEWLPLGDTRQLLQ